LYYKRITIGRFIRTKRGGFTIGLSGRLAFLPQSHLFSKNKIKNLVGIALPIKILSIKGSKNKRKKTYTLNIIVSNRQAIRAILTHNKKINPERIIKLNKLYTVCQ
jgi:ribosomal protein S1